MLEDILNKNACTEEKKLKVESIRWRNRKWSCDCWQKEKYKQVAMAHLLSDLANYFNLEETNIDNWTFKLYYKVSMVICMTGATVGIASQYFGDPIRWTDAA